MVGTENPRSPARVRRQVPGRCGRACGVAAPVMACYLRSEPIGRTRRPTVLTDRAVGGRSIGSVVNEALENISFYVGSLPSHLVSDVDAYAEVMGIGRAGAVSRLIEIGLTSRHGQTAAPDCPAGHRLDVASGWQIGQTGLR